MSAGNRWVALAVLSLARISAGLQFQSIGALSPLLTERLHIGSTEIGILVGLFSLPGVVLSLPGGLLGARLGDRRVVVAGLGLMAVGSFTVGVAETFAVAVAGRFASAIGVILLNVMMTKMVTDWFSGREIIFAMTIFINTWPIGIAVAVFTLPALALAWGLAVAFHVAALAAIAGALAVAALYPPAPVSASDAREPVRLRSLSGDEIRLVVLAAVPWALYNAAYAVMLAFVPTLLVRHRFSVAQAGLLLGVNTVLMILSVQAGGTLAQWRLKPDALVAIGLLGVAVPLAALPYTAPVAMLLAVGVVGGLPAGILVSAPASVLRAANRGPGMGLFYTVYYAGTAVLPPLAGWLQDALGGAAAIESAAVMALMTLACFVVFDRARHDPRIAAASRKP